MTSGHLIIGEEENKEKVFAEIKKNKRINYLEIHGDFVIYKLEAPLEETHMQVYLAPEIMFLKPITAKPDGWTYMDVATWDKKHLTAFLEKCNKWLEVKKQASSGQK
jgi:hypothetical protein